MMRDNHETAVCGMKNHQSRVDPYNYYIHNIFYKNGRLVGFVCGLDPEQPTNRYRVEPEPKWLVLLTYYY